MSTNAETFAYFTACLALALLVVWPCVEAWGRWER